MRDASDKLAFRHRFRHKTVQICYHTWKAECAVALLESVCYKLIQRRHRLLCWWPRQMTLTSSTWQSHWRTHSHTLHTCRALRLPHSCLPAGRRHTQRLPDPPWLPAARSEPLTDQPKTHLGPLVLHEKQGGEHIVQSATSMSTQEVYVYA